MPYIVYKIISRSKPEGLRATAVSADSVKAAKKRFTGFNTDAEVLDVEAIPGRSPEWEQDRIEGTCDLRDPQAKPPSAGSQSAEKIRASNRQILNQLYKQ